MHGNWRSCKSSAADLLAGILRWQSFLLNCLMEKQAQRLAAFVQAGRGPFSATIDVKIPHHSTVVYRCDVPDNMGLWLHLCCPTSDCPDLKRLQRPGHRFCKKYRTFDLASAESLNMKATVAQRLLNC
jgi:hypothetical protein